MKTLMMGQVTVNVNAMTEAVLHPETIVLARLVVTLPNGQEVELSVNEVLDMDLQAYDNESGFPIYNETDLHL
jgi:hypothetical protein